MPPHYLHLDCQPCLLFVSLVVYFLFPALPRLQFYSDLWGQVICICLQSQTESSMEAATVLTTLSPAPVLIPDMVTSKLSGD